MPPDDNIGGHCLNCFNDDLTIRLENLTLCTFQLNVRSYMHYVS